MPSISSLFPRVAPGLARRSSRSSTLRIVPATVRAQSIRAFVPPGIAAAAVVAVLMLWIPATSLGAGGEHPRAQYDGTSSGVLTLGAGYAVAGHSRPVRQLQRRLRAEGYATGAIDGLYGPRTARAVRRFQQANGLVPDGVVGPQTNASLGAVSSLRGESVRLGAGYGKPGGSERVRSVQRMLRTAGYDPGPVDGLFGPRTQAAVQWFQVKYRLDRTGSIDAPTLKRLHVLERGSAPTPAAEQAKNPRGNAAQPHGERAIAHANTEGGNAVSPLLLALLGALGAATLMVVSIAARSKRREAATASAPNGARPDASAANRPRPDPAPAAATASAPNGARPDPSAATATAPNRARPDPSAATASAPNGARPDPSARPAAPQSGSGRQPPPRVIGYATGRDRADLEHQAAAIERACRQRGWTLARVVRDNGSNQSMALTRPGLAHALEQLRGGSAARLVVDRLERLGRSVTDLRPLIQWCASNDVELVALEGGLDASMQEPGSAVAVGNGHEVVPKVRRTGAKRSQRA
jgi:peptidoglycan hydrolase-like protein with peptidoglycan-binding domain